MLVDGCTVTVQVFIYKDGKILLVHKREDEVTKPGDIDRPPGWELPGGRVDRSAHESVGQIENFLVIFKLPRENFFALPFEEAGFNIDIWLTAIREGLEETGLLLSPKRILFKEQKSPDHYVAVVHAEIVGGTLSRRSMETDDTGWFLPDDLPQDTYLSHRRRIKKSLAVLGLNGKTAEERAVSRE